MALFVNPILNDAEIKERFDSLGHDNREALHIFLRWLYKYAAVKAEESWRRRKAPMAVYWSAVKAWSLHLSRAVRSSIK